MRNERITFITRTAIFSSLAIVLYMIPVLRLALPIFPSFLKIHFEEVPIFIAGFAYGPLSASICIIIKTLVKFTTTSTVCVGELADMLYSFAFIIPAVLIYRKKKTISYALIGLLVGTLVQIIVASFFTTFVMLPFYEFVMGWPENVILDMCKKINPSITSLDWPFLSMVALPFNALKDAIVIAITFILYKRVHILIDKISFGSKKSPQN